MKLPVGAIGSLAELYKLFEKGQTTFYYTSIPGTHIKREELKYGDYNIRSVPNFEYMFCSPSDKMRLFPNYWYAWAYTEKNKAGLE